MKDNNVSFLPDTPENENKFDERRPVRSKTSQCSSNRGSMEGVRNPVL